MAKAKNKSSAKEKEATNTDSSNSQTEEYKLKIVKRFSQNELILAVRDDGNFNIQRTYVFNKETRYAKWLRPKDLKDAQLLLHDYKEWYVQQEFESVETESADDE